MSGKRITYTVEMLRALAPLTASMDLADDTKRKFDIIEVGEPAAPIKRRDGAAGNGGNALEAVVNSFGSASISGVGASSNAAPAPASTSMEATMPGGNHVSSSSWGVNSVKATVGINASLHVHGGGGNNSNGNSGGDRGGNHANNNTINNNSNSNNSNPGRVHDRRGGNNNSSNYNNNGNNNSNTSGHHNHHNHNNNHNNNNNNNNNNNSSNANGNAGNTHSVYSNFDSHAEDSRRAHGSDRFAPPTRAWRGNRNDEAFEEGYKYELERKAAHRKQLSEMIKREENKEERANSTRERENGARNTSTSTINNNVNNNSNTTVANTSTHAGTTSHAHNSEASVNAGDGVTRIAIPEEKVTEEFENLLAGITVADDTKVNARRSRFFGDNAVAAIRTVSALSSANASQNNNTSHSHASSLGGTRVMNRGEQSMPDATYYDYNNTNINNTNTFITHNNSAVCASNLTHMTSSFNPHAMNNTSATMSGENGWPLTSDGGGRPTSTAAELANMWTTGAAAALGKKLNTTAEDNLRNNSTSAGNKTVTTAPAEYAGGGFTVTSGSSHAGVGLDGLVFRGGTGAGGEEMGSAGAGAPAGGMTPSPLGVNTAGGGMSFVTAPNVRNSRSAVVPSGSGTPTHLSPSSYHHDASNNSSRSINNTTTMMNSSAYCPDAPPPSMASMPAVPIPTFSTASRPTRAAVDGHSTQNKSSSCTASSASSAAAAAAVAPMIWRAQDLEQMLMKSAQQTKVSSPAASNAATQDGAAATKRTIMVSDLEGMLFEQARQGGAGAGAGANNNNNINNTNAASGNKQHPQQQPAAPFASVNANSVQHHSAMQLQSSMMRTPLSQAQMQTQPTPTSSQSMMHPSVMMPGGVNTQHSAVSSFSTKHAPVQQVSTTTTTTLPGQTTGLNMPSAWAQMPRMNVAQRPGMQSQTPPSQSHPADALQSKLGISQPQVGSLHAAIPGVPMSQMMTAPAQYFTTQHQQPTYFVSQQLQQEQQQQQQTAQQMLYRTNAGNLLTPQQQQQLNLFGTGAQYLVPQTQQQQPPHPSRR